jgi:hypothetical protein
MLKRRASCAVVAVISSPSLALRHLRRFWSHRTLKENMDVQVLINVNRPCGISSFRLRGLPGLAKLTIKQMGPIED